MAAAGCPAVTQAQAPSARRRAAACACPGRPPTRDTHALEQGVAGGRGQRAPGAPHRERGERRSAARQLAAQRLQRRLLRRQPPGGQARLLLLVVQDVGLRAGRLGLDRARPPLAAWPGASDRVRSALPLPASSSSQNPQTACRHVADAPEYQRCAGGLPAADVRAGPSRRRRACRHAPARRTAPAMLNPGRARAGMHAPPLRARVQRNEAWPTLP